MTPRSFMILAAVTLITVVAAIAAVSSKPELRQAVRPETPVFPLLQERLNDIAKLEVVTGEASILFERKGDGWVLPASHGYAARDDEVRDALLALRDLKVVEAKTKTPEGFARLEVEEVTAEASKSRLVRLTAGDGTTLAEALLGKRRFGSLGDSSGGTYYRFPGEAQAWLAAGTVDLPQDARDWLLTEFMSLSSDQVARVEVRHADGAILEAAREAAADSFSLEPLPEGREADPSKTSQLSSLLSHLTFEDVRPAAETKFPGTPNSLTVGTFDGAQVTLELGEWDGQLWAKVTAKLADNPPGDAAKREAAEKTVAEITKRTEGWAYRLSDSLAARLLPKAQAFLKPEEKGSS